MAVPQMLLLRIVRFIDDRAISTCAAKNANMGAATNSHLLAILSSVLLAFAWSTGHRQNLSIWWHVFASLRAAILDHRLARVQGRCGGVGRIDQKKPSISIPKNAVLKVAVTRRHHAGYPAPKKEFFVQFINYQAWAGSGVSVSTYRHTHAHTQEAAPPQDNHTRTHTYSNLFPLQVQSTLPEEHEDK
mmetsp:Transcript_57468/g.84305  ORF Transcript_57468/g.84305 Transcript_57468/m.84305 type:complete len:188 (+) Transcript_57468:283-846(+)